MFSLRQTLLTLAGLWVLSFVQAEARPHKYIEHVNSPATGTHSILTAAREDSAIRPVEAKHSASPDSGHELTWDSLKSDEPVIELDGSWVRLDETAILPKPRAQTRLFLTGLSPPRFSFFFA